MAGAVIVMAIIVPPSSQRFRASWRICSTSLQVSFRYRMLCFIYVGVYFWRECKVRRALGLKRRHPEENDHATTRLPLWRQLFSEQPRTLLANDDFTVTAFRYASGVEGLVGGKCARLSGDFLPGLGKMIWDAGVLTATIRTMRNMFSEPEAGSGGGGHLWLFCFPLQDCWRTAVRRRRIPAPG